MRARLLAVALVGGVVALLPAAPAQATEPWWCVDFHTAPGYSEPTERPRVFTINGTVRVDNRCNQLDGLVVVWKMYENSSETFYAWAGAYTSEPTLHYGRIKVWIRFPDGSEYFYSKTMRYTQARR